MEKNGTNFCLARTVFQKPSDLLVIRLNVEKLTLVIYPSDTQR